MFCILERNVLSLMNRLVAKIFLRGRMARTRKYKFLLVKKRLLLKKLFFIVPLFRSFFLKGREEGLKPHQPASPLPTALFMNEATTEICKLFDLKLIKLDWNVVNLSWIWKILKIICLF
jgi:hypothetical protein